VVFQIDACLPDGSDVLLVHVRILNPSDHDVPIYWWSNIAVPQSPATRVIAPADSAWQFAYDRAIRRVPVPVSGGLDRSYPARARASADYFFDIAAPQRRWIAAVDGSGQGLVQTSTQHLGGRKLFHWGGHPGGARWQEWLSGPDATYLEIQAGLARTQLEHLPLPARTAWSWLEAYGRVDADPDAVHGEDWASARNAVETALDSLVTSEQLEEEFSGARAWVDEPPVAVLHRGSGWGALERHRRDRGGDDSLALSATPFPDDTLGPEQQPWLALLDTGKLPAIPPNTPPISYETDPSWEPLLTAAGGWLADLHLGVLQAARGDFAAATEAWSRSVRDTPNPWGWRNLGALAAHRGALPTAADAYLRAYELAPRLLPLLHEVLDILIRAGRSELALFVVDEARIEHRADGRLRMLEARAALDAGDLDRCGSLIDAGIEVPTLREGETSLGTLWRTYHERRSAAAAPGDRSPAQTPTVPREYDFTMKPETA
jgi:tetratricopeptide (TPR) repeat protein